MAKRRSRKQGRPEGGETAPAPVESAAPSTGRRLLVVCIVAVMAVAAVVAVTVLRRTGGTDQAAETELAVVVPENFDSYGPQLRAYLEPHIEQARANPLSAEAHTTLGLIYEANGRWVEAYKCFEIVEKLSPDDPLPVYHRAVAAERLGRPDEFMELLRRVVREFPDFVPAHHRLAHALLEKGQLDEAQSEFEWTVNAAPNSDAALIGLADLKLRRRDYEAALELLDKALAIDPERSVTHYLRGRALQGLGRTDEARGELAAGKETQKVYLADAWTRQLDVHRKDVGHQARMATAAVKAGRVDHGIAILEEALKWHPQNMQLLLDLAMINRRKGDLERSYEYLERAGDADPNMPPVWIELAKYWMQAGNPEKALECAEKGVELGPSLGAAHRTKGDVLRKLGRLPEAMEAWLQAVNADPTDARTYSDLARLAIQLDRPEEAIGYLRSALRHNPTRLADHLQLVEIYIATGRKDEARRALEAARRIAPDHERVLAAAKRIEALDGEPGP